MTTIRGTPFTTPEVRALQSGKRQFRLPVRPQPPSVEDVRRISGSDYSWIAWDNEPSRFRVAGPVWAVNQLGGPTEIKSRFEVGERLFVKEAWSPDHSRFYPHYPIIYKADGYDPRDGDSVGSFVFSPEANKHFSFRWRAPNTMPESVARHFIEITAVRAQRLMDMLPADVVAEGYPFSSDLDCFKDAWDSRHKPGERWADNVLVWCYEFEVTKCTNA